MEHSGDNSPNARGIELARLGRWNEAVDAFRLAISQGNINSGVYCNLGTALQGAEKLVEASDAFRQALALQPTNPTAHCYLADILALRGFADESISHYRDALLAQPHFPEATLGLGRQLKSVGRWDEAISVYRNAIVQRPDFALGHVHLATALLVRGQFQEGWRELQWWWVRPKFSQPRWEGEDLHGRRILLYCVGGFGDSIQFVRYVRWIAGKGGRIILCCFPELKRLYESIPDVDRVVATDEKLPEFDVHCHYPDLARMLAPTIEKIPAEIPYVWADRTLAAKWRDRIKDDGAKLKVGIVWAGSKNNEHDSHRSMPLRELAALGEIPGVRLFSLQKGPPADQLKEFRGEFSIADWTDELQDFADTAALIENLDVVVTVDTSVAHLAGAMGKKVWVLLPDPPEWRWMLDRADSPWYPTMRLFRQKRRGDWSRAMTEIGEALRTL